MLWNINQNAKNSIKIVVESILYSVIYIKLRLYGGKRCNHTEQKSIKKQERKKKLSKINIKTIPVYCWFSNKCVLPRNLLSILVYRVYLFTTIASFSVFFPIFISIFSCVLNIIFFSHFCFSGFISLLLLLFSIVSINFVFVVKAVANVVYCTGKIL